MNDVPIISIRESYDQLAEEYANHLFRELEPFDRDLLDRFASGVARFVTWVVGPATWLATYATQASPYLG
jgi:hypothetical protein